MIKISVIMPVYNTAAYLKQSIESVLAQTFADFELICINDGSTDKSAKILAEYAKKDTRIKVISQQNQGLSEARNHGLSIATGSYIAFIDSDDYYAPRYLEFLINTALDTKADIVGCDFKKIRNSKDTLKAIDKVSPKVYPNALDVLLHKDNFIHFNVWNKLYKREVIGDIRFVPHIYFEDWVFNCCVFEHANCFVWFSEKLYAYRYTNNSIMRSAFSIKKLKDYSTGIKAVNSYFLEKAPEKWEKIKRTRISRTVKMLMNSTIKAKNKELTQKTGEELKLLKAANLISYKGLALHNKIKLFRFLHLINN